nr:hypothetical protein [uncultured Treponema sp.]
MKKLLKILTMVAAVLTTAVLSTTCKPFRDDPEEMFSYWTSEVIPKDFSISGPQTTNSEGTLCIPSASDVKLTINLHNPRKFSLVMPTNSADAHNIIHFPGFAATSQPAYSSPGSSPGDYTLKQTADDKLELTYKSSFLKRHEWSSKNIGPEITFISTDGRKFSKKFSLNIEANTPPPDIGNITIAKKKVGGNWYYALCFQVNGVTNTIGSSSVLLHQDIKAIHIQKEGGGSEKIIPITVNSSGFNMPSPLPEELLSSVVAIFDTPPAAGNSTIYVKTDTELATSDALPKKYTVRLTDEKGLSSAPKEAETLGCIPDLSDSTKAWLNLKRAITNAQTGGVITVTGEVKATNNGSGDNANNGSILVNKKITIRGTDKDTCILNANKDVSGKPRHRIFNVGGELKLQNLTLKGGMALDTYPPNNSGGGIYVYESGKAELNNCLIADCEARQVGGGIYSEGGLHLTDCTIGGSVFGGNTALSGGGITSNRGSLTIIGGKITYNKSTASGGGLVVSPITKKIIMKIKGTDISHNEAKERGGGIYLSSSDGGQFIEGSLEGVTITKNKLTTPNANNLLHGGGGILFRNGYDDVAKITINGGSIEDNDAGSSNGGGIYIMTEYASAGTNGELILANDARVSGNTAKNGGGIAVTRSKLTIEPGCTIGGEQPYGAGPGVSKGNKAEISGGGIYVGEKGICTIKENVTIRYNKVTDGILISQGGGGLYIKDANPEANSGKVNIIGTEDKPVVIADNEAVHDGVSTHDSVGGGIANSGMINLTHINITGGKAHLGGGIYINNGQCTITDSEISNCEATGSGGGVYVAKNASGGGLFTMKGKSRITPSGDNANGKNDIFLSIHSGNSSFINLVEKLTGESPVGRISLPSDGYGISTKVLSGNINTNNSENYKRFTVTPGGSPLVDWEVGENGYLQ